MKKCLNCSSEAKLDRVRCQKCLDRVRLAVERYRKTPIGKARMRDASMRAMYGIGVEEYDELVAKQDGRCAICGRVDKLHIDHAHDDDRVRGLLCLTCNVLLGMAHDDPDILKAAIEYLAH